jgi:hypothetical protein
MNNNIVLLMLLILLFIHLPLLLLICLLMLLLLSPRSLHQLPPLALYPLNLSAIFQLLSILFDLIQPNAFVHRLPIFIRCREFSEYEMPLILLVE